jgi:anti-anti-sigma factor
MKNPTTLTIEDRPGNLKIIHIHGDLDSMGTHMVEDAFSAAITDRTGQVIVDLSHVNFISSAGMAMLLVKGKMLRQGGGNLFLAAASTRVLEVLALAGFQELFDVYPTLERALAALESS